MSNRTTVLVGKIGPAFGGTVIKDAKAGRTWSGNYGPDTTRCLFRTLALRIEQNGPTAA